MRKFKYRDSNVLAILQQRENGMSVAPNQVCSNDFVNDSLIDGRTVLAHNLRWPSSNPDC